ncbi:MAG: hypothetical protein JWM57_1836, partial [Phycisphaerales bacterium]|nr:hypothetical protein [Phycisphaerales bacterium]
MSQTISRTIPLAEATDAASVGGKAANLGVLIRAGFPVPDGFVIGLTEPTDDREAILSAYAAMGAGTVAARSSATAEDGAVASMAGQFETVLNVTGGDALLAAVEHCRASGVSDRVTAYAAEHSIDHADIRMAVVVQRQVNADVAGVLFTAAPGEPFPRQMLIEASWGLGESVVSGKVRPDAVRVAFDDGSVLSTVVSEKKTEWTIGGEQEIDADRRMQCCLTTDQIHRLWQLGRQVETHFGRPQDIEWAIAGDKVYLLQSRPITTAGDPEAIVAAVHANRSQLAEAIANGQGPWVLHNLVETLPQPTPLTWSVVRRFMSAEGGYGRAYAAIGFQPNGEFLDRIGGRIYMDAARAPTMFAADFP